MLFPCRRAFPGPVSRLAAALRLAVGLAAVGRLPARADDTAGPPPVITAERLRPGERIVLDGRLDEPAWGRAGSAADFRQRLPREREGAPASEPTEVRIVFDADHLYVGAHLHDTRPRDLASRQRARDAALDSDDLFSMALDPFGNGRGGYLFETNPAGVLRDALLGPGDPNYSWNGLWDVRTTRTAEGWQAEFSLPLRMLNFAADHPRWAVNFRRVLRRDDEESLWTAHLQQQGIARPLYAGRLEGLAGLSQGRGLLFTPYAAAAWRRGSAGRDGFRPNAGFDLTYSLTPNLRAALTINTDFAATEVDDRQVNLGRLPLFIPEKRDFFLEGSAVFAFPGAEGTRPYHSRRIGAGDAGPVPLAAGARLAGQAGALELGALQVRTRAAFGRAAEDFTVVRVKAHAGTENYAGLLYTRRAGAADPEHTVGVDARFKLLDLGGGQVLTSTPYVIWTTGAPAPAGTRWLDRSVLGHEFSWRGSSLTIFHRIAQIGPAFAPAVGFTDATGFRHHYLWIAYDHKPPHLPARNLQHAIEFSYRTDRHDRLIEGTTWLEPWLQEFASGDRIDNWEYLESYDVATPFAIRPGVVVPVGRYHRVGVYGRVRTADRRWWCLEASAQRGGFFNGQRTRLHFRAAFRPLSGLEASLDTENHFVRLPGGRFISRLHSARLAYSFTTRHALSLLTQFDNGTNTLGLQARFRWTIRPGAELFIGYLHDWDRTFDEPRGQWVWQTRGRETAVKSSWSWSF